MKISLPIESAKTARGNGKLDGLTILRFAHAYEHGGGVERYLDDVDTALLRRNAMTIIRVHLASDRSKLGEQVENVGVGKLVCVPVATTEGEKPQLALGPEPQGAHWRHLIRDIILYNPMLWHVLGKPLVLNRRIVRRRGEAIAAGAKIAELFNRHKVDLVILHFMGGADSEEVVQESRKAEIPYVVVNHFSNDRFMNIPICKHATLAAGVAGVNGLGMPRYLRRQFCNLSDGIDTDYFCREMAQAAPEKASPPLILFPARIVRSKGQMDLIRAGSLLRSAGVDFKIGFAGRTDSAEFLSELRHEIESSGMRDRVDFLGELKVGELRDWYARSAMVAFPSSHHEGLPRTIIEAQAMKLPVVAYAIGGVPEGIIDGSTGYLVKIGDVGALASRLKTLLLDETLRNQMGQAARRYAEERFKLERLAERHEQFYARIINSRINAGK